MFGVGSSGLPSDWRLFNVDGMKGDNRKMTREALDIILPPLEATTSRSSIAANTGT